MSVSDRGRLIYEGDEKYYRRSIIGEKICFYTLTMGLPLFATIVLGTACLLGKEAINKETIKEDLIVLAIGWGLLPFLGVITFARTAFADKLRIYENGFVPPKLPSVSIALRVFLRKISAKDVSFVRYDELTDVVVRRLQKNDMILVVFIRTKDGLINSIERGDAGGDEPLNKLVEVLKEKRPEIIVEKRVR